MHPFSLVLVGATFVGAVTLASAPSIAAEPETTPESAPAGPESAPATRPASLPAPESAPASARAAAPGGLALLVPALLRGFDFGTYGRVIAATDLRGGSGRRYVLVAHGPRVDEPTYLELDLYYRLDPVRVHVTLAFTDALFHFAGDFDAALALRNLYIEADRFGGLTGLSAWVGSRMYRGDDIYLLDFWPLDELNMVGGGIALGLPAAPAGTPRPSSWPLTEVALAGGVNRLADDWQLQTIAAPGNGFVPEDVVFLDRERFIFSARLTHERAIAGTLHAKARLYGEVHRIGTGSVLTDPAVGTTEELPADEGWLAGIELGAWGFGARAASRPGAPPEPRQGFVNLFLRIATGLAAYGELAVPYGLDAGRRAAAARELTAGLSGNYDFGPVALTLGAYVRRFRDADPNVFDRDDLLEGVGVARLTIQILERAHLALQASYEALRPSGLTASGAIDHPAAWRFAVIPLWSPFGRGAFTRPHLRILYTVALPNEDARALLNPTDPRAEWRAHHFLGLGAEWWFNSSFR